MNPPSPANGSRRLLQHDSEGAGGASIPGGHGSSPSNPSSQDVALLLANLTVRNSQKSGKMNDVGAPSNTSSMYSWSYLSGFRNRSVEREFRQFIRPPAFTFTTFCILTLLVAAVFFLVTPSYNTPADDIKVTSQWVLLVLGTAVTICDLLLLSLLSIGKMNPLTHSWWHIHLRTALSWVILAAKLTLSVQFWECPHVPDPVLAKFCYGSLGAGHFSIYYLAILLHIPVPQYVGLFVVDTVMECMFGQLADLKGQPVEAQFSRPFLSACVGCITMAITVWNEREYRRRFLDAKSLELERALNKRRKREIVAGLSSLCERRDLPSLLSGVPVRYESPDAGILITEVANFVAWRCSLRPIQAVHFLGVLYDGVDTKRIEIGRPALEGRVEVGVDPRVPTQSFGHLGITIDRLWWKGDAYATGVGLTRSSTQAEREVLLRFANWQLALVGLVTQRQAPIAPQTAANTVLMELKFGYGRGHCQSLQVPGATVTRFYSGEAIDRAKESCRNALNGEVQLHRNPLLEEVSRAAHHHIPTHAHLRDRPRLSVWDSLEVSSVGSSRTSVPDAKSLDNICSSTTETNTSSERNLFEKSDPQVEAAKYTGSAISLTQILPLPTTAKVGTESSNGATFSSMIDSNDLSAFLEQNLLVEEGEGDTFDDGTLDEVDNLRLASLPHSGVSGRGSNDNSFSGRGTSVDGHSPRSSMQPRRTVAAQRRLFVPAATHSIPPRRDSHHDSNTALLQYAATALAAPLSDKYAAFLNARVTKRSPLAGGIAVTFVMFTLGIIVIEDAYNTASFVCAGLACVVGLLIPFVVPLVPEKSGLVLCILCNIEAVLIVLISLLAEPFLLNRNPDPQNLCFGLVAVLHSDGVRPTLTISIASAWGLIGFIIELTFPADRARRRVQHVLWGLLVIGGMLLLAIDRIIKNRRSFDDIEALAVATARSTKSKEAHEKVLKMLLPPHVVPLYQQLRDDKASAAVTQRAQDVALLSLTLHPNAVAVPTFESTQQRPFPAVAPPQLRLRTHGGNPATPLTFFVTVMECVVKATKLNPEVSVIFTDGDTLMLGGPLQPPEVELEELPAASKFANAPLKQLMYEKVATDVSLALLTLLSEISQLAPVTALLHRGDALTMIYGEARPMFALQSGAAETSEWLLQALFPQQMCVTEAFLKPYYENYKNLINIDGDEEALMARISRDVVEQVAPMLRIGTPFRCRGKGIGVARLFPLLKGMSA